MKKLLDSDWLRAVQFNCKGWFSLEHKHKHKHKHKYKWKQARHKHKHKQKHKKNERTYFSCAVFTSNVLDITTSISTRKTELFVFLVLMLMSSALLVKTAQDK